MRLNRKKQDKNTSSEGAMDRDDLRRQIRETMENGTVGGGAEEGADGGGGGGGGAPMEEREFWRLHRRIHLTKSAPKSSSSEQSSDEDDEKWIDRAMGQCKTLLADDDHLDRILVTKNYNPQGSVKMFFSHVRFRARWIPPEGMDLEALSTAMSSGAWRLCGYAKDGCPVSNYKLELWDPSRYKGDLKDAVDEYTRYVVYMIELALESGRRYASSSSSSSSTTDDRKDEFMVIFDLTGFRVGMVTKTNIRHMIGKLIYIAKEQYPEQLRRVVLINAPFGFETAWSIIRPTLGERTGSKIAFGKAPADLLPYVDRSALSVAYGGAHEEYPVPSRGIEDEATAAAAEAEAEAAAAATTTTAAEATAQDSAKETES